ncbi:glycosyl transferase, group 1 [Oscillochloris trichoides DG-6]|uniref:Glycosyl transferase, group 1 n=1 Tax=Oscillochloris trichoides DG-6 TaxID=765420 RepID=E1IC18_9CHLR|nr:glycosyl transferase, group 1 [Oscillochloris trichoides DG-6]
MLMRVVFIIDHLRHDGTQQVLKQLVAGLRTRQHHIAVICLNSSWDAQLVADLRAMGAEVRIVGRWRLITGYGILYLWYWLRQPQYDVAITLLFASDVLGRIIARLAGVPRIISSIRARNTNYAGWQRALVRATMPFADAVVVNSSTTLPWAIEHEGAHPDRTTVILNGVDASAYRQPYTGAELRAMFGIAPDQYVIGCVGRLTPQKGQDLLLEALAQLEAQHVHLLLIGHGETEAALRDLAQSRGIAERVHVAGYRRDVACILGALDLYVHPARFEGMPNALLEAMAAGCPCIATAADGSRELIEDGLSGWLVPVDDAAALSHAIHFALAHPEVARQYGIAAQQRAEKRFSIKKMVESWEMLFEKRFCSKKRGFVMGVLFAKIQIKLQKIVQQTNIWVVLKVLLAMILIVIVFFQVNPRDLLNFWQGINLYWLPISLISYLMVIWITAIRYWILVDRKIHQVHAIGMTVIQTIIGNFFASSAGAISYIMLLRGRHSVQLSHGIASVLLSRLGDLIGLTLGLVCASILIWSQITPLHWLIGILIFLLFVVLVSIFLVYIFRQPALHLLKSILHITRLDRLDLIRRSVGQISILIEQSPQQIKASFGPFLFSSMVLLLVNVVFNYTTQYMFGVFIGVWELVFVFAVTQLLFIIPVHVFGGLGIYEITAIYLYALVGVPDEQLAPLVISSRIYLYLLNLFIMLYLPIESYIDTKTQDVPSSDQ